jgi:hypothetical protein
MFPSPASPLAEVTVAVPVSFTVTAHVVGVVDVNVTGSPDEDLAVRTAVDPSGREASAKKVMLCAAFAPTAGVVIPVTPLVRVATVGSQ